MLACVRACARGWAGCCGTPLKHALLMPYGLFCSSLQTVIAECFASGRKDASAEDKEFIAPNVQPQLHAKLEKLEPMEWCGMLCKSRSPAVLAEITKNRCMKELIAESIRHA